MLRRLIETAPTWFPLPIRIALGLVFVAHGAQKVFGLWGGPGLTAFSGGQAPMGLSPAWFWLGAAAIFEFLGGVLVLLGLLTRLGALMIVPIMLVAIIGVHWSGGFFSQNKGYEYALVLLLMALALLVSGGGRASIDEMLMNRRGSGRRR